ncbi:beta-galactosidase (plasmid) [Fulvitalea axinellae]|uniref:beta-galactosidase n=1 Tax=Fulvitalea axinellae TaxID=1182444 RepID=A0AAU9D7N3_9BACT|nr:beta-galactosidase [Fulvitalea axinellae]
MKSKFRFLTALLFLFATVAVAQESQRQYLSGKGIDDAVSWDFYCTKGMNSGKWSTIPVPSSWEPQGFGTPRYGLGKNMVKADERGIYKHEFTVDKSAKGKRVEIVFEGSMVETTVFVNGKKAGAKHVGGFYRFKYDISKLVHYGQKNSLRVEVDKMSKNGSVNSAEREGDFWTVAGIYRPVYLEISPKERIEGFAVDARMDGSLSVDVRLLPRGKKYTLRQSLYDLVTGEQVGEAKEFPLPKNGDVQLQNTYNNVKTWDCESPNLYVLSLDLLKNGKTVHTKKERIGFRTVETRPNDGIYLNGVKMVFKGSNYHSWHPEWGRATSKRLSIEDALLMKEMNMNAVRMAHYPHDQHFYDVCDSLGLMVFDELGAYQASYDFEIGKRVLTQMMEANVNHPSIVAFANGNEGGYDLDLEPVFKALDPQKRFVYHPTHYHNGFDAQHYKSHNYGVHTFHHSRDIFVQTEFLHALYDGGAGAGLSDFWEEMRTSQNSGGGFIWAFLDEGIRRRDLNDSIDCSGDKGADGILGPHREKEASFYTVRDVWSPIQFTRRYIPESFDGRLKVENQYLHTNLDQCNYIWRLETLPTPSAKGQTVAQGKGQFPSAEPGLKAYMKLNLPSLRNADLLVLEAFDKEDNKVNTWTWPIKFPMDIAKRFVKEAKSDGKVNVETNGDKLTAKADDIKVTFDLKTGLLTSVHNSKGEIPFNNGPRFVKGYELKKLEHKMVGDTLEILSRFTEKRSWAKWRVFPSGLVKLSYRIFNIRGRHEMLGITFDFPETPDLKARWLGKGPYRVWNNRTRGQNLGEWGNTYNNTRTGAQWVYPEFKGYFGDLYWAEISNNSQSFTIVSETDYSFLHLFTPEMDEARNCQLPPFPEGNISLMNAIPAIGTKINSPDNTGPNGQPHSLNQHGEQKPLEGDYWFDFR